MSTRTGLDWTTPFPTIAAGVARLLRHDAQELVLVKPSALEGKEWLVSEVLPLAFRRTVTRGVPRTLALRTDGGKFLPETLGAGCAFLDYDADGWQDILLVNSMDWPGHKHRHSTLKLYHNNRNGTFSDVTFSSGVANAPKFIR